MAKSQKRGKGSRGRLLSLVVLLLAAGVFVWGRHDLVRGVRAYLLDGIDYLHVEQRSDLPLPSDFLPCPAEVNGIPDYEHLLRFPHQGSTITCYRMVGFENQLVVCSYKGLRRPEAIVEIIRERSIRGRLTRLGKSPLEDRLRRGFRKAGNIRIREEAFLLLEEDSPFPSRVRLGILAACLILCCLSAYRLIKH
jgi:hypothetical protein